MPAYLDNAATTRVCPQAAQAALELALRLAQGKVPAGTEPLARDAQHSAEALDKLNEVFLGH